MKRTTILLIASMAFFACQGPSKKDLAQQKDSLLLQAAEKDKDMNALITALMEIDNNIQEIKKKEKIIAIDATSGEELNESIQNKINNDVKLIYDLMIQNKEKVQFLEKQLKNSKIEGSKLKQYIQSLNEKLQAQSAEIIQLTETLKSKNLQIDDLNFSIEGLSFALDSLNLRHQETSQKLESTTEQLYTGYYVFGTKKELKEQKIISNDGLPLIGKTKILEKDFNADYFTKIDIRETISIPLYRKKIKILSTHPEGSYTLDETEEETLILNISDKEQFWSISRYLVIQVN